MKAKRQLRLYFGWSEILHSFERGCLRVEKECQRGGWLNRWWVFTNILKERAFFQFVDGSRKRIFILIPHTQIPLNSPSGLCYSNVQKTKKKKKNKLLSDFWPQQTPSCTSPASLQMSGAVIGHFSGPLLGEDGERLFSRDFQTHPSVALWCFRDVRKWWRPVGTHYELGYFHVCFHKISVFLSERKHLKDHIQTVDETRLLCSTYLQGFRSDYNNVVLPLLLLHVPSNLYLTVIFRPFKEPDCGPVMNI